MEGNNEDFVFQPKVSSASKKKQQQQTEPEQPKDKSVRFQFRREERETNTSPQKKTKRSTVVQTFSNKQVEDSLFSEPTSDSEDEFDIREEDERTIRKNAFDHYHTTEETEETVIVDDDAEEEEEEEEVVSQARPKSRMGSGIASYPEQIDLMNRQTVTKTLEDLGVPIPSTKKPKERERFLTKQELLMRHKLKASEALVERRDDPMVKFIDGVLISADMKDDRWNEEMKIRRASRVPEPIGYMEFSPIVTRYSDKALGVIYTRIPRFRQAGITKEQIIYSDVLEVYNMFLDLTVNLILLDRSNSGTIRIIYLFVLIPFILGVRITFQKTPEALNQLIDDIVQTLKSNYDWDRSKQEFVAISDQRGSLTVSPLSRTLGGSRFQQPLLTLRERANIR